MVSVLQVEPCSTLEYWIPIQTRTVNELSEIFIILHTTGIFQYSFKIELFISNFKVYFCLQFRCYLILFQKLNPFAVSSFKFSSSNSDESCSKKDHKLKF
jgi:hypothetical protein